MHTFLGRYLGFLLSLLIAGCAPFPKVSPPEPEIGVLTLASKESFSAPSGSWPSDRWWTQYDDSQLDQLMIEALRESPSLRVAQARVRRAQAVGMMRVRSPWICAGRSIFGGSIGLAWPRQPLKSRRVAPS
ncbi:MAG: hypothetical protein NWS01_09990 [Burkholderiales bacterium]|nr:hypothetical protein [Burkholderiales bacterium]